MGSDMRYLGIDLKSSSKHASTIAVLKDDSRLDFIGNFSRDDELIDAVEQFQPKSLSIGAPLSLPDGLCCLETACSCRLASGQRKGRQAEIDLARMGISCFFTNKGSITRRLIYRAINLNQQLTRLGCSTVETYPHASKVILFGDQVPSKNSPKSLPFMKEHLPTLIQELEPQMERLDRSACDALINAHTVLLYDRGEVDLLGSAREGLIVVPRLIRLDTVREIRSGSFAAKPLCPEPANARAPE